MQQTTLTIVTARHLSNMSCKVAWPKGLRMLITGISNPCDMSTVQEGQSGTPALHTQLTQAELTCKEASVVHVSQGSGAHRFASARPAMSVHLTLGLSWKMSWLMAAPSWRSSPSSVVCRHSTAQHARRHLGNAEKVWSAGTAQHARRAGILAMWGRRGLQAHHSTAHTQVGHLKHAEEAWSAGKAQHSTPAGWAP
jgi:hypothetical protein